MSQYGSASELDKRTLIVCALEVETQGQLDDYDVLYTGVGKVNATFKLTQKFGKYGSHIPYDLVVNYGTAGSRNLPIGELVDCTRFVQRDMKITQLGFYEGQTPFESPNTMIVLSTSNFNPIDKRLVCGTGDSFVDDIKKESLYNYYSPFSFSFSSFFSDLAIELTSFCSLCMSSLNLSIEISKGVNPWLESERVAINIPRSIPPKTAAKETV